MASQISDVPFCDLLMLWPQVRPHLERALKRETVQRYTPEAVLKLLLEQRVRLWVSWDVSQGHVEAIAVTEIATYPLMRECRIWLVSGRNMRAWVFKMRDQIEAFARAMQCGVLTGGLRRGWVRIGGEGWHETGVTFEKELN